MKREIKKYLFDIKIAIDSINDYLGENRNFFEYQKNKLLRRGIEREIEIIGEATNRILNLDDKIKLNTILKFDEIFGLNFDKNHYIVNLMKTIDMKENLEIKSEIKN